MEKRWKCSVCGYIHAGPEPPETCPVCGVDSSKFVLLQEKKPVGFVEDLWKTFRLHPVLAHLPNGLLPAALLFSGLALVFGQVSLDWVASLLCLLVTAVTPLVFASGLYSWKTRFNRRPAAIFKHKQQLAGLLFLFGVAGLACYSRVAPESPWLIWGFRACLLGMVGCVALLGHFGAKLVFGGVAVLEGEKR